MTRCNRCMYDGPSKRTCTLYARVLGKRGRWSIRDACGVAGGMWYVVCPEHRLRYRCTILCYALCLTPDHLRQTPARR
jgi:hypothetical protein